MSEACDVKYQPITGQKGALFVKDPVTQLWLHVAGTTNINGPQTSVGEVDSTNMCSTAKEFIPDLVDYGSLTATAQILFGSPGQWLISESLRNYPPDTLDIKERLSDDGLGNGEVWGYGQGYCNSFPVQQASGSIATVEIGFRLTGAWTWERPQSYATKLKYSTTNLNESGAGNGRIVGTITVGLTGDTFDGTAGQVLTGVSFSGTPTGLTAECKLINTQTAVISFTGVATNHVAGLVDTVTVTFDDDAFTSTSAADVYKSEQIITLTWK